MLNIASGLANHGYSVDLVLVKQEGELVDKIPSSIRLINLDSRGAFMSIPGLLRYFRIEHSSLLFSSLPHISLVALSVKLLSRAKLFVVVVEHNTLSQTVRFTSSLKDRVLPLLMRLFYPLANHIVAVSTGVADDLSKMLNLPHSRIEVIYNPVVTPELLAQSLQPVTHPWFSDGEPPVIIGMGRLTKAKGFSTLIRAFSKIRKSHVSARLMILGEGGERTKLEKLVVELGIDSDVSLPGFHPNAHSFLRCASVFVLSSLWEGLPTVMIEALACDTPIVSTDCPSGPREILENGKWGTLVPVGDEDALAVAIQNTLATPHKPIPEIAWVRFKQEEVLSKYLQLITSINYSKTC